jgi:hypothetical protein
VPSAHTAATVESLSVLINPYPGTAVSEMLHLRFPALLRLACRPPKAAQSFIDGPAGGLAFDDSSVDLVWCERVLQHLSDPEVRPDGPVRCCWTLTRERGSFRISIPTP